MNLLTTPESLGDHAHPAPPKEPPMKARLFLAVFLLVACVLFTQVAEAQDISGPDISDPPGGDTAFDPPSTVNDPDTNTIDPDAGNRDAGQMETSPDSIVTLNDYAPNQGPADFYRSENNFYGGDAKLTDPMAGLDDAIVAQLTSVQSSVAAAPASAASAGVDSSAPAPGLYMDDPQAVALGQQQRRGAARALAAMAPSVPLAEIARSLRAQHLSSQASKQEGPITATQNEDGTIQVCGANGANCHTLR
jgi:hypothetical protein